MTEANIADFTLWTMLGLCSGWVPGDTDLSLELCVAQYAAEQRDMKPSDPLPTRQGFKEEVAKVCWPRSRCNHE